MKSLPIILSFALCLCLSPTLPAQTNSPTDSSEKLLDFWEFLHPGGTALVSLAEITAIDVHSYLIEGGFRVWELNVCDKSAFALRIYSVEKLEATDSVASLKSASRKAEETAEKAAEKLGAEDPWQKVVKDYPTTTHAKTVEFRVDKKETVLEIYKHVRQSWVTKRGGRFTVPPPAFQLPPIGGNKQAGSTSK